MTIAIDTIYAGTLRPLGSQGARSGILKVPAPPPWRIGTNGLEGDSQGDLRHHGGPEKALHQYAREHYATWLGEDPTLAGILDAAPAFGENLSTFGMLEETVCIGDVYRIGGVLLQVSQGRQPCWRLNVRFAQPLMATRVQSTGRTGWYYRVLEAGLIVPGERLTPIDRPRPNWPITRALSLLYHRTLDFDELDAMAAIPELAPSWRNLASRRISSRVVENWKQRLGGS